MSLKITKAGALDTIQDGGRYGWQHLGINPGGAMDRFAMQLANALAGNESSEAVMEMVFPAPSILFQQPALFALAGADLSATIDGEAVPCLQPVLAAPGSMLRFHAARKGAWAYLGVHGGLDLPGWLGSYSTHLKAGIGGYQGRALQKDDELPLRKTIDDALLQNKSCRLLPWRAGDHWDEEADDRIAVLPGKEWEWLTDASKDQLMNGRFVLSSQSDRMGYRLEGIALKVTQREELVSSAVAFGALQLLPDGQLIVLMADHQTTGGYPVVGQVITAHHSRLAQQRPGEALHFRLTDMAAAEKLMIKQQQHLQQVRHACAFRLAAFLNN